MIHCAVGTAWIVGRVVCRLVGRLVDRVVVKYSLL